MTATNNNEHLTILAPASNWRFLDLSALWKHRELFYFLAWRDIKVRYKQTLLGAAWALFQPLIAMLIFSFVFGQLVNMPSDGIPYPLFVFAGLLPWTFFATSLGQSAQSLVANVNLITKVYFPRIIIPYTAPAVALIDFFVSTLILLVMMAYYNFQITWTIVFIPLLLLGELLLIMGLGAFFSALALAYRDLKAVIPYLIQIWLYLTPVIYPVSIVPEEFQGLLALNPMYGYIHGFRAIFLGQELDPAALYPALGMTAVIFVVGTLYFRKTERRFADIA